MEGSPFGQIAASFQRGGSFMRNTYKQALDQGRHLLEHMHESGFNALCDATLKSAKSYREGIGKQNKAWTELQAAVKRMDEAEKDTAQRRKDGLGMSR